MALWAIADLHLSLGADKPMDVFSGWQDYVPRLEKNWRSVVSPEDTVVIAGDISWAMGLSATEADFSFLHSLPGQKLLLKGNHDYWWTTRKKMETFFAAHGFDDLHIVHNSAYPVDGTYAVCGTRGWFYDAEGEADRRVLLREAATAAHLDPRGAGNGAFPRLAFCIIRRYTAAWSAARSWTCSRRRASPACITATSTARGSGGR